MPCPSLRCLSPPATALGSRVAPKCKTCFTFRPNMQIDSVLPPTVSQLLQFELIKTPPQSQSASRSVIIKIVNKSRITSRCNANNCFLFCDNVETGKEFQKTNRNFQTRYPNGHEYCGSFSVPLSLPLS